MSEDKKSVPRWTEDEVKSVRDYIWAIADQPPVLDRTDDAIESKFAEDLKEIRKIGRDRSVRHTASMVALGMVRHKGIKHEGGHMNFCNRALNLAFFVGGFNTDPDAQKCRKAALEAHRELAHAS